MNMKKILLLVFVCASAAFAVEPGPVVLESPVGTVCRSWVENGVTFLEIRNETGRSVSGTVTLNEIYEKAIVLSGGRSVDIDGRWIEVELPAHGVLLVRLGK